MAPGMLPLLLALASSPSGGGGTASLQSSDLEWLAHVLVDVSPSSLTTDAERALARLGGAADTVEWYMGIPANARDQEWAVAVRARYTAQVVCQTPKRTFTRLPPSMTTRMLVGLTLADLHLREADDLLPLAATAAGPPSLRAYGRWASGRGYTGQGARSSQERLNNCEREPRVSLFPARPVFSTEFVCAIAPCRPHKMECGGGGAAGRRRANGSETAGAG